MILLLLGILQSYLFLPSEVKLDDLLFLDYQKSNVENLLKYDVDRILTPYIVQSHNSISNDFRYDYHLCGDYLSALSLAYSVSKDDRLKKRIDYMVSKLFEVQRDGYIGYLSDNQMWNDLREKNFESWEKRREKLPFYSTLKIMSGLRDAYVYANNKQAFDSFLRLCDWSISIIENLDEKSIQYLLTSEYGGMNEILADAYNLTGNDDYLRAAYRYCQKIMFDGLKNRDTTFLDNKLASALLPEYIGFERIAQEAKDQEYHIVAENFWRDIIENRTVCAGEISLDGKFLSKNDYAKFVNDRNGIESCNTYYIMYLSKLLFCENHDSKYVDFYENALLNHVLSSYDRKSGKYVCQTPLQPGAEKIYSQSNKTENCCVGAGMKNQSKYAEFIYAHDCDTLFVNLFINSTLNNSRFSLCQNNSSITIKKSGTFTLAIRHPIWCDVFDIKINGEQYTCTSSIGGYEKIERNWEENDEIEISLSSKIHLEFCPIFSTFVSVRNGPYVYGMKLSSKQKSLELGNLPTIDNIDMTKLKPFYTIQQSRYIIYFPVQKVENTSVRP